ncbi:MAG: NAD(P)/FAD-dependent oxidoreductase [Planctomycetota bacterium]
MFTKPKVVVLGGGFGGLEAVFYLRHKLGSRVDLTLVSDSRYFTFKPSLIYIPFGESPEKCRMAIDVPLKKKNIHFVHAIALEIEPIAQRIETSHGPIFYDYLVVATGAAIDPLEIPGFKDHAHTIWTVQQMLRLGDGLERLIDAARNGTRPRLLFAVPPQAQCVAPLYELAMMTDSWLADKGVREKVEMSYVTAEPRFFDAFGPRMHHLVEEEFDRRHIEGYTGQALERVEPGVVHFTNRGMLPFDMLVGMPPCVAMQRYANLPTDERGFLQVNRTSRQVRYRERIFAVGDTADFPIKQAFLALLQADAAADHIAADILGTQPEIDFQPLSLYVMEQLDQALFAQVPLKYKEDGSGAVEVDPEAPREYQVGVSPLWRVGKKVMGRYLPWRFAHGEPFHSGVAWNTINAGLKVAKSVLAS